MKRLLYSHILYNSVAAGFENGWFDGDQLSPIGRIQQSAQRWVRQCGPPGVMHTQVAILLDFDSGWSFPRHLYTDKLYRVWGNLPYESEDYFIDGVLNLLYVASMTTISNVLGKMPILGATDLLLSLHRHPENNFSAEQTEQAFEATLRRFAAAATSVGVTLHLRQTSVSLRGI